MEDCDIKVKGINNEGYVGYVTEGKFHFTHYNMPKEPAVGTSNHVEPAVGISNHVEEEPEKDEIIDIPPDTKIDEERSVSFIKYKNRSSISSTIETVSTEEYNQYDEKKETVEANSSLVTPSFIVRRKRRFTLSYEFIIWFVFVTITIAALVDRFAMGGDWLLGRKRKRIERLWNNTSAGGTFAAIVWAFTGRVIITAQNMMFYTTLWCIPNMISEFAPRFINIDSIREAHIKMHRLIGIFLIGIPSVGHVLLVFVPPIIDRTEVTVSPPSCFNYSKQFLHLNWTKFWDPAAVVGWSMNNKSGVHLTSDEVYRLVLMIVLFCFLFPLSRSNYLNNRSFSLAIGLHAFAGIWYAVDNIRKISHEMAHLFNLPFLLLWCIDRLLSITLYRRSIASIVKKRIIGMNEYVDMRVKLNTSFKSGIGDVYYVVENKQLYPQRAHPFTTYKNNTSDNSWDIGFIISVMEDDLQWFPSWTRTICSVENSQEPTALTSWGPYRSAVWKIYRDFEINEIMSYNMIATGSGFGYLLDVLGVLANKIEKTSQYSIPNINIYYTVRCDALREHFQNEVETLLRKVKTKGTANVSFYWYATSGKGSNDEDSTKELVITKQGRINFEQILMRSPKLTTVYFVGNPSIATFIGGLCKKYHMPFIKDFTNTHGGSSDKSVMVSYLKKTLFAVILTLIAALLLSSYLDIGNIRKLVKAHV